MFTALRLKLVLLVCGNLLALLICEFLLRISGLGTINGTVMIHDSVLVRKPYHKFYNRRENKNWVYLNNLGFHDVDRDLKSKTYRLLVIGDSFVEGAQVSIDNLFTRLLELRFAQLWLSQIEIVNCGVSGTQTAYQYKLWQEYVDGTLKLRYDHVLLVMFLGNDLTDNVVTLTDAPNAAWFLNADGNVFTKKQNDGSVKTIVKAARNDSALVNTVYESLYRLKRLRIDAKRKQDEGQTNHESMAKQEVKLKDLLISFQGTTKLIEAWAKELHEGGRSFDIALIPGHDESRMSPVYSGFIDRLKQSGAETGFGVLYLEIDQNPAKYRFASDAKGGFGHLNLRGHAFVADALYDWLTSRYGRRWEKNLQGPAK